MHEMGSDGTRTDGVISYYGFLPDGELSFPDQSPERTLVAALQDLWHRVVEALQSKDTAAALRLAQGAVDTLAHELRPEWADGLRPDETLVQAVVVEVEIDPVIAREDSTLEQQRGTAIWVSHRATVTSRSEALAKARQLAAVPGRVVTDQGESLVMGPLEGRTGLWAKAWM